MSQYHHLAIKPVMRRDRQQHIVRLCRAVWQRGRVGDGAGYSAKLSLALRPRLFQWTRELNGWFLTIAGVRIHYRRSYGGIDV